MSEESLFVAALEASGHDARKLLLDEACRDNPELRRRVEQLLANHARASGILDRHEGNYCAIRNGLPSLQIDNEHNGTVVGQYRLIEPLGEGGFGLVYTAEQKHPFRRTVALKIIKPGMDSREILARFERERQALALMDHPNIARVLDAGSTATGRPFFVMEWVQGRPITDYADDNQLALPERLKLFVHVCHAVQHAHQKGIIHRDLKPSNILVTEQDGQPMVKVIDFGIAKALQQRLDESSFLTCSTQMLGTPTYMSPEQVEMKHDDVDTRSDIYSLGVLLYELLTGTTPFERERLETAGFDEWRRIIREEEPLPPSSRVTTLNMALTTVSANRRSDVRQLSRACKGELDWIVMRALEKDRNRRYASASDLARDIEHYLHHEPVDASPPSSLYRFRKMVRRHRVAVMVTMLTMILLIAGIIGTSIGMLQAKEAQFNEQQRAESEKLQRQRAERAELDAQQQANEAKQNSAVAQALVQFVRNDILGQARSTTQLSGKFRPDPNLTVCEALDRASSKIGERFKTQPAVEAAILHTMGVCYKELGQYYKAADMLQRSLKLRDTGRNQSRMEFLETQHQLAQVFKELGQISEAVALNEKVHDAYSKLLGAENPYTLYAQGNLALAYHEAGQHAKALKLLEQVREVRTRRLGTDHPDTLLTLNNLAMFHSDNGNVNEAIKQLKLICDVKDRVLGTEHLDTLPSLSNLATAYWKLQQFDHAIPLFERVLSGYQKQLGKTHHLALWSMVNLGVNYSATGRHEEAIELLKVAYETSKVHHVQLWASNQLIIAYCNKGMTHEAIQLMHKNLELHRVKMDRESMEYAAILAEHGARLYDLKEWTEAESLLRKCLTIRKTKEPHSRLTFFTQSLLGSTLMALQRYDEAEPLVKEGYDGLSKLQRPMQEQDEKRLNNALDRLIQFYIETNKPEEVKKWKAEKAKLPNSLEPAKK